MTISGIGGRPAAVQQLLDMRSQLDDLQRQLGTGKRSATYAGQGGLVSGLGVALRTQLANIDGYGQTTTTVAVRLQLAQNALTGMTNVATNVKTSLIQPGIVGSNGQTTTQLQARDQLDQLLNLLNTKADGRSLFSGRATDQRAVVPTDTLLNGDGVRAGLKQVIDERRQADLGASGLGRLVLGSPSSGAVSIAEDAVGSPFGFKIASITSDIAGATVSAPAGSPPAAGIDFSAATPQPGQSVSLTLNLPDGTTTTVKLTATNASPPGAGEFTIGADAATTAANLQSSLTSALTGEAKTSLLAASAMTAGNDFFNLDATHVPQRVAGPPFDTATALTSSTSADTVYWYTGELASGSARDSVTARIDNQMSVNYGIRANEDGIRSLVQSVAVYAATSFDPADATATNASGALVDRVRTAMSGSPSMQTIDEIATDIGSAQAAVKAAQDRQKQTGNVLNGLIDQAEGISTEEAATSILALQTRLQASLQTTAALYKMSLTNYI